MNPIEFFKNQSPYNCRYVRADQGSCINGSRKKVSIVGFEQAYTKTAPMDDHSYEIWGLNHANRLGFMVDSQGRFRADRWFDLHQKHAQSEADMAWIDECQLPIYLTDKFTKNPYALAYPIEQVISYSRRDYFCSSFAYMLALAVLEGFEVIRLDGINLSYGRERLVERGNLEYWIGVFSEREDCEIVIPETSTLLFHPYRYGFDYSEEKRAVEQAMAVSIIECSLDSNVRGILDKLETCKNMAEVYQATNCEPRRWADPLKDNSQESVPQLPKAST